MDPSLPPSQSLHCVQVSSLQTGDLNSATTLLRHIGKGMLFFLLKQLHWTCSVGKTWGKNNDDICVYTIYFDIWIVSVNITGENIIIGMINM